MILGNIQGILNSADIMDSGLTEKQPQEPSQHGSQAHEGPAPDPSVLDFVESLGLEEGKSGK